MTSNTLPTKNPTSRALQRFGFLAVIYVLLIFLLPPSRSTMRAYHLSPIEYRVILLSVTLPIMVAWFAAFFGYAKLREYAHSIRETPEGTHFDQLASGCSWLALSLPIPAIAGLLLNAIANHWQNFHPTAIIINNYVNLLLPLVAFSIISVASRGLISSAKLKFSLGSTRTIMLLSLTGGVFYCYLTFRQFNLASFHSTANPYFLPLWLMVFTIIIPYLYAWFTGLLAAYEIAQYSKQVHGLLYRRALRSMTWGLIAVIASSIARQYLNSVQPRVGHLILDYRLLLGTVFSLIGGVGFVLLAYGATRLKKIEEL